MKKRLTWLLLACACTAAPPPTQPAPWRAEVRHTIDDGDYLAPDGEPGEAGPSAMVRRGESLWVTYAHLRAFQPAGPGWLAQHDATTLERRQFIRLTHADGECRNPTALLLDADLAHIVCAGRHSFAEPSDDGRVMTVSLATGEVLATARVGHSPGSITRAGDALWLGDGEVGGAWRVEADTLSNPEYHQPCLVDATHQGYVSDLLAHEGRLFAACFNDDTVVELDPVSGKVLHTLPTGDAPLRMRVIGDALYVLDNLGGTVSVVGLTTPPTSRSAAIALGAGGEQGGNDPQGIDGAEGFIGVTNSAWGTFVVVDLETQRLTSAIDLKPSPDAASNFPSAVTYEDGVFHVLVAGLELDTNDVPGEIIRIVKVEQ